jgi:hypothetical protein
LSVSSNEDIWPIADCSASYCNVPYSFTAIGALALCSLFAHAAPGSAAEPGVIYGKVVDGQNAAISGARITLTAPSGRYRTQTNSRGEFAIVGVTAASYTLTVRKDATVAVTESGIGVADDQITDLGTISIQQQPSFAAR